MIKMKQEFESFNQWINHASDWLTSHENYNKDGHFKAVLIDSVGRICTSGQCMMRARDDNTFPVRWWWPDQVIKELVVKKKSSRMKKPTIEEVRELFKSKSKNDQSESFYNHYESNGWKVGRNSMKSWKASVAQWISRDDANNKTNKRNSNKIESPKGKYSNLQGVQRG